MPNDHLLADVFIISDLHMGAGDTLDDFLNDLRATTTSGSGVARSDDADLADFLGFLTQREHTTLIINGDFIDFIQIELPASYGPACHGPNLDVTEAQSLAKL